MELMGQWAPSVQKDQSVGKMGLGDKLGWFAFPTLAGGAGAATDGVGGGNGIAVGKNAPPEAVDFLKFFMDKEQPGQAQHRRRRPLDDRGHGEHGHRPEPAGGPRRSRRGDVHAALPRPGDEPAPSPRPSTTPPSRCSSASPPPRRSARPSPTRPPRSRRLPASGSLVDSGPRAGRLSRPAHSVGGKQGRVASRTPRTPARVRGCPESGGRSASSCCPRWCSTSSSSSSRSSRPRTSACTSGTVSAPLDGLHRARELPGGPGERRVLAGGGQQRVDHRPVAPPPDPVLARARRPAQSALPRTRHLPTAVLRSLRPVGGDHRASSSACSSSPMPWSTRACRASVSRGSSRTGWATPTS